MKDKYSLKISTYRYGELEEKISEYINGAAEKDANGKIVPKLLAPPELAAELGVTTEVLVNWLNGKDGHDGDFDGVQGRQLNNGFTELLVYAFTVMESNIIELMAKKKIEKTAGIFLLNKYFGYRHESGRKRKDGQIIPMSEEMKKYAK